MIGRPIAKCAGQLPCREGVKFPVCILFVAFNPSGCAVPQARLFSSIRNFRLAAGNRKRKLAHFCARLFELKAQRWPEVRRDGPELPLTLQVLHPQVAHQVLLLLPLLLPPA